MILLNYLVFLDAVALFMSCVAGLLTIQKVILSQYNVRAKKKFFCYVRMCVLAQRSTITALGYSLRSPQVKCVLQ